MLSLLGRMAARRPWWVLMGWAGAVVVATMSVNGLFGGDPLLDILDEGEPSVSGEALTATQRLTAASGGATTVGASVRGVDVDGGPADGRVSDAVSWTVTDLRRIPGVEEVRGPFEDDGGERFLLQVTVSGDASEGTVARVEDRLDGLVTVLSATVPGVSGSVGGERLAFERITEQVEQDLRSGELVALPLSLAVMVVVFGGFLAAGVPLVAAVAAVSCALALVYAAANVMSVDTSVVTVVTVLGLGLCIDYGLLFVSRYREELRRGTVETRRDERRRHAQALSRTMATAGRTIAFSGLIVALSLAGLLVFDAPVLRALGVAGVSVVVVAVAASLTAVPALLILAGGAVTGPGLLSEVPGAGPVIRRLGDVGGGDDGLFARVARAVQARPALTTGVVVLVLAMMTIPVLALNLRNSGVDLLPVGDEQRRYADDLATAFPALDQPDVVVVTGTSDTDAVDEWAEALSALPAVADVAPARSLGEVGVVVLSATADDPRGPQAQDLVRQVRDVAATAPFAADVTGPAAIQVDLVDSIVEGAPVAVAVVVVSTLVLLFLMTGSLVVPLKALVLNVLSLGASIGVLVWVFQDGRLAGPLDFTATGGVEVTVVPLVLAFGFGLSMDYEVFLLSRIKDMRDRGFTSDDAVALGLQRSGRIITSAALILVIVFLGFATGELLLVKQLGVALAVAVVVDATLVRMLLVPAAMTLMKEWNWWAPAPMRRWHDRHGWRETDPTAPPTADPATPSPGRGRARPIGARHVRARV